MLVQFPGAGTLPPKELGRIGERVACEVLQKKGWKLLRRNIRVSHDELDALFFDPIETMLVVVEVKTRANADYGSGIEAITPTKIKRLRRAIVRWLAESDTYFPAVRIDCVEVTLTDAGEGFVVTHYPEVG